jgi:hypothetical protein
MFGWGARGNGVEWEGGHGAEGGNQELNPTIC